MNLKFFIDRPVLSIVISVTIVLLGFVGLATLPVEQYPDIAPPTVNVWANYPGANAETVQKSVVIPLEEAINGVEGMTYVTSEASNDGSASLMIYFRQGTDPDMAAVNVQNRVATAQSLLPAEVVQIGITTEKQQNAELKTFALYDPEGRYSKQFLNNYIKINVEPRIKRVQGVGKVQLFGSQYSMRLWLKPDRMAQFKLIPEDIATLLAGQNIEAATGSFGENHDNANVYTMKYRGRFTTAEQFGDIVVKSLPNGDILRLKDIADIELGDEDYNFENIINGKPAAMMTIYQTAGSNASAVINEIDRVLEECSNDLPKGLEFVTMSDTNRFLYASIREVGWALAVSILLVVLVVYLFLQDFKATLIPTVAIFVSVIGTFGFMAVAGFSVNLLTLFALVLAIGTVVDNAIIVIEAVQSKFDSGYKSSYMATNDAMGGITSAIVVSTIIFMAVFIPTSMMGGTSGTFYKQFGITMAVAVGLSAVNALTLSPALCALMMRPADGDKGFSAKVRKAYDAAFKVLVERYKNGVLFFIRRPVMAFAVLGLGIGLLVWLMRITPSGFVPDEDTGTVMVSLNTKPGTSAKKTLQIINDFDRQLSGIQGVDYRDGVGGFSFSGSGPTSGIFFLSLKHWDERKDPSESAGAIMGQIYALADSVPDVEFFVTTPPMIPGYGMSNGFDLYLQDKAGGDLNSFKAVAEEFVDELNRRPEIERAYSAFDTRYPQYWVDIDAAQCERVGITPAQVLSTMAGYFGGNYASNFNRFNKLYRVMLQADPATRVTPESVKHFYVRTGNGEMAPLSQFVTLTKTYGPQSISRFNLYNSIAVNGTPAAGYSSGDALRAVAETAEKVLPRNYGYELGGISREESATGNNAIIIFAICATLVFLILAGLYESLLLPLVVIISIPCGLMGSFLFAKLFGLENNIYLQTGLIMLIGLLAKTAILITEYAGERRNSGMTLKQAAVGAAKARLRPILMTALTMIFGMLPLMFATGVGANGNSTLGTGAVGGMVVGTLTLLFLVPALWMVFQKIQERFSPVEPKNPDWALSAELERVSNLKNQNKEDEK
ncbi:efflux RND transporter permease subunit [Muribaculum intestinale]|uniref:Efflux RND transporter permease subunit n=1 Tax=Muribaculum intestinale TaxID=1796646 RepID=A0A4S2FWH1_9BACT|nr:efflux RND transporter permease subunit [Muribaculum intestinale]MYM12718.1 efflux RND transporter permease subunit [Muribaculum intestinale]TGY73674.1 efflux RND transporter permease subunit [Muribaculum intestinale]